MKDNARHVVVLDLEAEKSPDDCRHCGCANVEPLHLSGRCTGSYHAGHVFEAIGWDNKVALGLSIGCYYDSRDSRMHWFDGHTLEATMRHFVDTNPLLVSFNGISFDFPLMRGLLRQRADEGDACLLWQDQIREMCDTFKTLCATSYDLLAEIWKVDPARKFERGLNSLDAISQANGLGAKEMTGAQAPRLWQQGRCAEVIGYCQGDVEKTRALFEMVCAGQPILRGDGQPIMLRNPYHEGDSDGAS